MPKMHATPGIETNSDYLHAKPHSQLRHVSRLLGPRRLWALSVARYRLFGKAPIVRGWLDKALAESEREAFALARRFRPARPGRIRENVDVRTLLCHRHVDMYLWTIRTFLHYSDLDCPIVVHDDGSLNQDDRDALIDSVPWIQIIEKNEAASSVSAQLVGLPWCRKYHSEVVYSKKLFDAALFSKDRFLILDSDIIFVAAPGELTDAIRFRPKEIRYNREDNCKFASYTGLMELIGPICCDMNSGLLLFPKSAFNLSKIESLSEWYFTQGLKQNAHGGDQLFFSVLAASETHRPLGPEYTTFYGDPLNSGRLVCKHFHTCSKRYMAFEGIQFLLAKRPDFIEAVF